MNAEGTQSVRGTKLYPIRQNLEIKGQYYDFHGFASTCGCPNSSACGPSSTLLGRTGLSGVADRVEMRSKKVSKALGARILMQI